MDRNEDFDSSLVLGKLIAIATKYAVPLDVECVPNIQEWCSNRGIDEKNPDLSGSVFRDPQSDRYLVVIANPLTSPMIHSAIDATSLRGLGVAAAQLDDPQKFVTHLFLHEVAHALDRSRSEKQCDEWAFQEMGITNVV